MTHESLSSLQDAVASCLDDGDLATPLELIQGFVARIIADPASVGRIFAAAPLDDLCMRLGQALLARMALPARAPTAGSIAYVASEFGHGGHTLVVADFVRLRPGSEHRVLLTDVIGRGDFEAGRRRLEPLGAKIEVAPAGSLSDKLTWLVSRLLALAPERTYWFHHHQDAVATAAAQPSLPGDHYLVHHGDHHLCLGLHVPHVRHVDLQNLGYFNCRDALGIRDNVYWPIVCDDLGPRDPTRGFLSTGALRTCSSGFANKFEVPYLYQYADIVPDVLQATGGHHLHVGGLSPAYVARIRTRLRERGIPQDRFAIVGLVPSLWRMLVEGEVDAYLASWPIGGGRALIETMGAGIPTLVHANYASRFHSDLDGVYPDALTWRTPAELLGHLAQLTPERLAHHSRAARQHYETFHVPQRLAPLLRGDGGDGPAPLPLRPHETDALQVFLDERVPSWRAAAALAEQRKTIAEQRKTLDLLRALLNAREGRVAVMEATCARLASPRYLGRTFLREGWRRVKQWMAGAKPAGPLPPPRYEGTLDRVDDELIAGWAWDASRPGAHVEVEFCEANLPIATVLADAHRLDLEQAGKGRGDHAFAYPTPECLKDGKPHVIRVRIREGAFELHGAEGVTIGGGEPGSAPPAGKDPLPAPVVLACPP